MRRLLLHVGAVETRQVLASHILRDRKAGPVQLDRRLMPVRLYKRGPRHLHPRTAARCLVAAVALIGVAGVSAGRADAASVTHCGTVYGRHAPDGSYNNSAYSPVSIAIGCAATKVVLEHWLETGTPPPRWHQAQAASTDENYDPTWVLSSGAAHILVGSCGGSGCGGPFHPANAVCGSDALYVEGMSCARAEQVQRSRPGGVDFPGWTCGPFGTARTDYGGFDRFCAHGHRLFLFLFVST
jgi:hypothetical protein